jgi:hypothetical protein
MKIAPGHRTKNRLPVTMGYTQGDGYFRLGHDGCEIKPSQVDIACVELNPLNKMAIFIGVLKFPHFDFCVEKLP